MMSANPFVVVLGCTVLDNGEPSDWLRDRLDAFLALLSRLMIADNDGSGALVVTAVLSGAAVRSTITEAECMRRYLTQRIVADLSGVAAAATTADPKTTQIDVPFVGIGSNGVAAKVILVEEEMALDTPDNLYYSVKAILARGRFLRTPQQKLYLVTSDFHMARGRMLLEAELRFRLCNRQEPVSSQQAALASLVDIVCVAAPTPTLFGERLVQRQEREQMLIEVDAHKQQERHQREDNDNNACRKGSGAT